MDGGKLLFQLIKIVFGYVSALIGSGLFLAWGLFQANHPGDDPVAFGAMVGTGLVGASVLGAVTLLPAAIAVGLAEFARLRGMVFHIGMGGAIAFVVWTIGAAENTDIRPGTAVVLAAGFLAGAIYWLIAGRTSGIWHGNSRPKNITAD